MFETSIAGSLPKPAWLAETNKLWPQWKAEGDALRQAKADATLLWIKAQEDAGLDIVCDGEQSRQHFVHGFLEQVEGIDFENKVKMGIRDNRYDAMVPQVVSALRLKGRVHAFEAQLARAHTRKKLKFTLPGPMTIVDTVADRFYGDRVKMAFAFAELLNQEALALQADGVDIIQFDEPAFNVYMKDAADWGVQALERAAQGLTCTTAVHICYGYGIKANTDWKSTLGDEWRQYETVFPALAKSRIDQVSLECIHSHVPPDLMRLLAGKDVMVGVIDVASDVVETPKRWPTPSAGRWSSCRRSGCSPARTAASHPWAATWRGASCKRWQQARGWQRSGWPLRKSRPAATPGYPGLRWICNAAEQKPQRTLHQRACSSGPGQPRQPLLATRRLVQRASLSQPGPAVPPTISRTQPGNSTAFCLGKSTQMTVPPPAAQITPGSETRSMVPQVSKVVRPGSLTYILSSTSSG